MMMFRIVARSTVRGGLAALSAYENVPFREKDQIN
jgi:hypothetical protein